MMKKIQFTFLFLFCLPSYSFQELKLTINPVPKNSICAEHYQTAKSFVEDLIKNPLVKYLAQNAEVTTIELVVGSHDEEQIRFSAGSTVYYRLTESQNLDACSFENFAHFVVGLSRRFDSQYDLSEDDVYNMYVEQEHRHIEKMEKFMDSIR